MLSSGREVVQFVGDPVWTTAAISVGSALLGAIVGSVTSNRATRKGAEIETAKERARQSHNAAAELIDAVYSTSRSVHDAVADGSPPRLAVAANDFSQAVSRPLAWISDSELEARLLDHRRFAAAVGISGTPEVTRLPPKRLVEAFDRHAQITLESLDAHIRGQELPPYTTPPFANLQELIGWR
jgi:hypothetical protein